MKQKTVAYYPKHSNKDISELWARIKKKARFWSNSTIQFKCYNAIMQIFHFLRYSYFINRISLQFQVMPPLNKHFKPLDEGWSKQQPDDLMEKTFTATFPAFKFPDRERLHVSCGVQLCKGKCPNVSSVFDNTELNICKRRANYFYGIK